MVGKIWCGSFKWIPNDPQTYVGFYLKWSNLGWFGGAPHFRKPSSWVGIDLSGETIAFKDKQRNSEV